MLFTPATPDDLAYIYQLEQTPKNARYIDQWSMPQHQAAFDDAAYDYFVLKTDEQKPLGYLIARHLPQTQSTIKLQRIVMATKRQGQGSEALDLFKEHYKTQGHEHAILHVVGGHAPLLKFYGKNGFEVNESERFAIKGYVALGCEL